MLEFVYDYLSNNESKKVKTNCDFCKQIIDRNDQKYSFKIFGLGKHDNKIVCFDCMKCKFDNRKKIIVMK
jgi:hypothetical protein